MQTIRWRESLTGLPEEFKNVKVFLVTAWEKFENSIHRNRAHQLDGAYSCNLDVREDNKVKRFDKLVGDLTKLK